jgi:hypothetical protein
VPENPYEPPEGTNDRKGEEPFLTPSEVFWAAFIFLVPAGLFLVIKLFPDVFWSLSIGPPPD